MQQVMISWNISPKSGFNLVGGGEEASPTNTSASPPKILACYKYLNNNNLGFNTVQVLMLGVKVHITY